MTCNACAPQTPNAVYCASTLRVNIPKRSSIRHVLTISGFSLRAKEPEVVKRHVRDGVWSLRGLRLGFGWPLASVVIWHSDGAIG